MLTTNQPPLVRRAHFILSVNDRIVETRPFGTKWTMCNFVFSICVHDRECYWLYNKLQLHNALRTVPPKPNGYRGPET